MPQFSSSSRNLRQITLHVVQGILLGACWTGAFWLRLDMSATALSFPFFWTIFIWVCLIKLAAIEGFGLSRSQLRYASIHEISYVALAMTISSTLIYLMRYKFAPQPIPKGVILIDWNLSILALAGLRFTTRFRHIQRKRTAVASAVRRVLIIGAGDAGEALIRQMMLHPQTNMQPVGILDDDQSVQGLHVHRVPVLGKTAEVVQWAKRIQATELLIAIPSISSNAMRQLVELTSKTGLPTRTLPSVNQIISGEVSIDQVREIDITDLLGREPVKIDQGTVAAMLKGKSVMVTGAGGSIGSEIARQLLRFSPSELILLERAEPSLFVIETEILALQKKLPCGDQTRIRAIVADVGDRTRMRKILSESRPAIVCHAAAHKHVPLMEANPAEAVKNNVFGTCTLAECASESGVETFVMISTDKAINPTSVMGTTKRVAEIFAQALARRTTTKFVTVRFGNVLGSSGSVIPIFLQQIRNGGPVTVTHPEMQRYFMLIPEAVLLVLQAASFGQGGQIYVLDMGDPVRIVDMARKMIELSGLRPGVDIEIKFTRLRPGEKLFEELRLTGEDIEPTPHPRIRVVKCIQTEWTMLNEQLALLRAAAETGDEERVRATLAKIVPEYAPIGGTPRVTQSAPIAVNTSKSAPTLTGQQTNLQKMT